MEDFQNATDNTDSIATESENVLDPVVDDVVVEPKKGFTKIIAVAALLIVLAGGAVYAYSPHQQ